MPARRLGFPQSGNLTYLCASEISEIEGHIIPNVKCRRLEIFKWTVS